MRLLAALSLLALAAPASGQTVGTSPRPDAVKVTVYRDLARGNSPLNLQWLNGYALISETRRVTLPPGASELRFEGVAGGIIPQSAIVTGLPEGVIERNRDAYLLSPGTLLDRSLGRRVHLRRTDRATGRVTEEEVLIRSGADGAVVLHTPSGFEALRCTGEAQALVHPEVPVGLSPKPTLSVRVRSAEPVATTITLSYLATGFDWQANYIAKLSPDGSRADLFAWLTLASTDETSFIDADTRAVAGRLNREHASVPDPQSRPLQLECWPSATTSDVPAVQAISQQDLSLAPPPPPPPPPAAPERDEIVVTGSRVMRANQERLGDVKLYRIPEPVTVAANSQKQVALLEQPGVRVWTLFRSQIAVTDAGYDQLATRMLQTRNRTVEGLGLPLPAGQMVLFGERGGRPILLGQGSLEDLSVGEDVEIGFEQAPGVRARLNETSEGRYELSVTNDLPQPIQYEAELFVRGDARLNAGTKLARRNGRPLWVTTIPANGRAVLAYSLSD